MTSQALAVQTAEHQRRGMLMTMMTAAAMATALLLSQASPSNAQARPVTFADLAEQVSPSVVNITTSTTIAGKTGPQGMVPEGSPFEDFFNDFFVAHNLLFFIWPFQHMCPCFVSNYFFNLFGLHQYKIYVILTQKN